jgi:hypothetical protein
VLVTIADFWLLIGMLMCEYVFIRSRMQDRGTMACKALLLDCDGRCCYWQLLVSPRALSLLFGMLQFAGSLSSCTGLSMAP